MREGHITFTVTRHLKDNKSKATSFLLLLKMIAKLELTQSTFSEKNCAIADQMPSSDTSGLVLECLLTFHIKDAKLKWIKVFAFMLNIL